MSPRKQPERIGIRELKSTLSRRVRQVKEGASFVVTEHGRPVARVMPETADVEQRLMLLRLAGLIEWSGSRLGKPPRPVRRRKELLVAELLVEDRG